MTVHLTKAQLNAQKALIRSCVADGVGIDGLEDMPSFRFVPGSETARDKEATADRARPSKRSYPHGCKSRTCPCHKSKWFRHAPYTHCGDYHVPMAGDSASLTEARREYSKGNPGPLRAWLAKTAVKRAATWAEIDARARRAMPAKAARKPVEELAAPMAPLEPVAPVELPARPVEPVELVAEPVALPSILGRWNAGRVIEFPAPKPNIAKGTGSPVEGDMVSRDYITAQEFRAIRDNLGWTQQELADWADVNVKTIKRFEAGEQRVPHLWKLALQTLQRARAKAA